MEEEMKKYLSDDEKMQLDALMKKAERRKEQGENAGESGCYLNFRFIIECGIGERPGGQKDAGKHEDIKGPSDDMEEFYDFQKLLRQVCEFCKKYDQCMECRKGKEEEEEVDLFEPPL